MKKKVSMKRYFWVLLEMVCIVGVSVFTGLGTIYVGESVSSSLFFTSIITLWISINVWRQR